MRLLHELLKISVTFDDPHLELRGLVTVMALAQALQARWEDSLHERAALPALCRSIAGSWPVSSRPVRVAEGNVGADWGQPQACRRAIIL